MEEIKTAKELSEITFKLRMQGKKEEVERIVERIAGMDASSSADYVLRGAARRMSGDEDQALADFRKALELNPKNTDALLRIGWIQLCSKELEQALETFESVIDIEPDNLHAYKSKGDVLYSLKHFDKLFSYYQNLIDRFPDSADFWKFMYSWVLFAEERNQEALDILEALADHRPLTASFASPPSYLYYLHKAAVLTAMQRLDDALDTLKTGHEVTEAEEGCLPCFVGNCWRVPYFQALREPDYREKLEAIIGPKPKIHQKQKPEEKKD